ncbi:MAG: 5-bromo-4-chloroindolyl phosphate hydrolysis family protein [Acutalibacter sp.]|jgi:5-bromo-4-chloroindolyl phosphate hydrolysis protein
MNQKGNDPLWQELRSSQVYKTLKDVGIPLAGKLADGLGKAAQELDQAVNTPRRSTGPNGPYQPSPGPQVNGPQARTGGQQTGGPQVYGAQSGAQAPGQQTAGTQPGASRNSGPQTSDPRSNGYYHYSYPQGQQTKPPQAQAPRTQAQAQPQAPRTQAQAQSQASRTQAPPFQAGKAQRQAAANRAAAAQHAAQQQAEAARRAAKYSQGTAQGVPQGAAPGPMKMVRQGSPAKYYITAVVALLYALNAPMYEIQHYLIFAVVLVLVFLVSGALFKGKKVFVPVEPEKPKEEPKKEPEKEEKSHTGNPEVDKIIDEGREYLKKLRAADDAIPDEALSEDITRMERASADIFRYIGDHPEKAPQIRKFMNYYLPTTLKLLGSYQRLSAQNVKGENISSTLFNIAGMMHTVADAFEKQLDSLYAEEAMDISADITVFETLLKQEGFVEEEKEEGK